MKRIELADILILLGLIGIGYALWTVGPEVMAGGLGMIVLALGLVRYLKS